MRATQNVSRQNTNDKPWFNESCKHIRDLFHETRRTYNEHKTVFFKKLLKDVNKQFKSKLRKANIDFDTKRVIHLKQ